MIITEKKSEKAIGIGHKDGSLVKVLCYVIASERLRAVSAIHGWIDPLGRKAKLWSSLPGNRTLRKGPSSSIREDMLPFGLLL